MRIPYQFKGPDLVINTNEKLRVCGVYDTNNSSRHMGRYAKETFKGKTVMGRDLSKLVIPGA